MTYYYLKTKMFDGKIGRIILILEDIKDTTKRGGWLKRLKVIVDDSGFEKVDDNKHVMY